MTISRWSRLIWGIIGGLGLCAAGVGVIAPSVYDGVISPLIEPGVFAQDLVALAAAMLLVTLAATTRGTGIGRRIVASGLLGFFFYAYGIYAIERIYTPLYPVYLAIFGLSLFALIHGFGSLVRTDMSVRMPRPLAMIASGYSIFIALMFNGIWFSQLLPLLQAGNRIDFTYSIYIIDLCFVMPAFVIAAVSALRGRLLGLLGVPALFIVGAGILSPLALAEVLKPGRYGLEMDVGGLLLYLMLSVVFLVLSVVCLRTIKTDASA